MAGWANVTPASKYNVTAVLVSRSQEGPLRVTDAAQ
jgi:hypothetical protein